MKASDVYDGSNGEITRAYYARLEALGPLGVIAMNLFRSQKASARAKRYSRKFKGLAYDKKGWSLQLLSKALTEHGAELGIGFGWGRDDTQHYNPWVLYVEIPQGQVSFHSPRRYEGPDYEGCWDGCHLSALRIIDFCDAVAEGVAARAG